MKTYSPEEFKKLYGEGAFQEVSQQKGIGADISNSFQGSIDYVKEGIAQGAAAKTPIGKTEAGLKQAAGLVGAALSPLAPVTKYIGEGINYAADKISENKGVQDFAMSKAGQTTARVAEDVQNTSALLGLKSARPVAGAVKNVAGKTMKATGESLKNSAGKAGNYAKGTVRDIVPTSQGFINHQVAQALELTPGDLANIEAKTGNNVGSWLADNNLIGENAKTTQQLVDNFKTANYNAVRAEISKIPDIYQQYQVPRFVDALKQIRNKIEKVPGLEADWVEVEGLLGKKDLNLSDVQRAKELIDEHFGLYKITGDVGESVVKEGLANIRSALREFIEGEVKAKTGADISAMNNNVMTARSLSDAITKREPKGLTRSNFRGGDLAALGYGSFVGGPALGIAMLFVKKVLETPTMQLRIAKIVDEMSDARKAKTAAELQAGKIPNEFKEAIIIRRNGKRLVPD